MANFSSLLIKSVSAVPATAAFGEPSRDDAGDGSLQPRVNGTANPVVFNGVLFKVNGKGYTNELLVALVPSDKFGNGIFEPKPFASLSTVKWSCSGWPTDDCKGLLIIVFVLISFNNNSRVLLGLFTGVDGFDAVNENKLELAVFDGPLCVRCIRLGGCCISRGL